MNHELAALEARLREPFFVEQVSFVPGTTYFDPTTTRWTCRALPQVPAHVYVKRLNACAFGQWSTPYTPPLVAGPRLIVPVTLVLYGVAQSAQSEIPLCHTTQQGHACRDEHTLAFASSQAFRLACARFGLGSYLATLPTLWLPYDPYNATRPIPITERERIAWVEKLYMEAGLQPRHTPASAPVLSTPTALALPATAVPVPAVAPHPDTAPPAPERVDEAFLAYLRAELTAEQAQKSCRYYKVADLCELTVEQAMHLSDYIDAHHQRTAEASHEE